MNLPPFEENERCETAQLPNRPLIPDEGVPIEMAGVQWAPLHLQT